MRRSQSEPETFRCFVERATRPSLFGDVASDFGSADYLAVGAFDRRYGQRDVDTRTVFPHANSLKVFDALTSAQPRQNLRFLIEVIRWNDDGDGLADYFVGGVAEDPFRPLVPTGDDALEGFADDGVIGRLDQRRQPVRRKFRTF